SQRIGRVLQGGEVQMRGHFQRRRWHGGFLGIGSRGKYSLLDFLVALDSLILLGLPELLQFIEVTMDGLCQAVEVVRQQVRVGESHDRRARSLREGASV